MVKNGTDIFWGGAFLSCLAWHATTVALLEQWHFLERAIFGWTCVDMILDPFLLDREKNDISVNRRTARCSWGTKVLLMLSCIVLTDFFTDAFWSLLCLGAECKAGARISCGSAALLLCTSEAPKNMQNGKSLCTENAYECLVAARMGVWKPILQVLFLFTPELGLKLGLSLFSGFFLRR